MTICAGIFYLREGGIIRLSEPLLKFRPRQDLIQTLLHEMIHAYLYITRNFKDRGEHGDEFKGHMNRINKLANTNITVYHSFHDEVNNCRKHVWRCDGPCRQLPPFHGYVKRAMNRAPGKNDTWWAQHQSKCNGKFIKISEPENYNKKDKDKSILNKTNNKIDKNTNDDSKLSTKKNSSSSQALAVAASTSKKLDSYFVSRSLNESSLSNVSTSSQFNQQNSQLKNPIVIKDESEKKPTLSSLSSTKSILNYFNTNKSSDIIEVKPKVNKINDNDDIILLDEDTPNFVQPSKAASSSSSSSSSSFFINTNLVECPVCFNKISDNLINSHVNNHFTN